jgi:transcriptional regulator with XRE-family HTH domain
MDGQVEPIGVKPYSAKEKMPEAIRLRMKELGMRVADLSRKTGIPAPTLYHVLSGRSDPSLRLGAKLAWGLGWSLDYFVQTFFTCHPIAEIIPDDRITHVPNGTLNHYLMTPAA